MSEEIRKIFEELHKKYGYSLEGLEYHDPPQPENLLRIVKKYLGKSNELDYAVYLFLRAVLYHDRNAFLEFIKLGEKVNELTRNS